MQILLYWCFLTIICVTGSVNWSINSSKGRPSFLLPVKTQHLGRSTVCDVTKSTDTYAMLGTTPSCRVLVSPSHATSQPPCLCFPPSVYQEAKTQCKFAVFRRSMTFIRLLCRSLVKTVCWSKLKSGLVAQVSTCTTRSRCGCRNPAS